VVVADSLRLSVGPGSGDGDPVGECLMAPLTSCCRHL
jgi:hypothetical protein